MSTYIKEYQKLLRFARQFKGVFFLAAVCMGFSTLLEGFSLGMMVPILDRVLTNQKTIVPLKLPDFLMRQVDRFNAMSQMDVLKYIISGIIVLMLIKEVFIYFQNYLMNVVGQGVVREARNKLYAKFQALSLKFYASKKTGELISRVVYDVGFITEALSYGLTDLVYESMKIVMFAGIALFLGFSISWKLAVVTFFIIPAVMYPVVQVGKRIKKLSFSIQEKMADLNTQLSETLQGAYIVKVFNREEYEQERFKKINFNYYKFVLKGRKRSLVLSPLTELVGAIGTVFIIAIASKEIIAGKLSAGTFVAFIASTMSMLRPIKKLSNVHAINQQAFAASKRIYEVLDDPLIITEKPDARDITSLKESIRYQDLDFSYDDEEYVLKKINLEVKKGEIVALVGHSGAGKSTLVGLLPRLYDPQKGKVLFDGADIRDLKLRSLRELIGVVSQEMVLFNASVRDNIGYGKLNAGDKEIIEAAKKAYAWDFIQKMPEGLDTLIGDRGFKISGGERQRIAIARAMLKDAPVLILDEATSQLDSQSEQMVQAAFYSLMAHKTTFVIAHRLSTVQKADRILVLDHGRIAESGTHEQLLAKGALYKKLYEMQFAE